MELYAKIVDNKVVEVSSGIGTSGNWVTVEGYQGENQTLTYDASTNTVTCKDEIDEVPVATISELEAIKLELTKDYLRSNRNKLLAESEGIFAETAGGVSVACLKRLVDNGVINENEETVLFITGAGLKTIEAVEDEMNPAIKIPPNSEEFMDEFSKLG